MTDDDRVLCAGLSQVLRASAVAGLLGLVCAALAMAALLWPLPAGGRAATMLAASVAVLSLAERYLALRLRLDAGLFEAMGRRDGLWTLDRLDSMLARLGLRPAQAQARSLDARVRATLSLWRGHLAVVALQAGLMGALAWCRIA